ncbi:Ig-like domain-containing protein [Aquimarina agarilytica]|uniref:Ig-like domain-containing protein n=1 Tax=Aquimarina agarilytica TaxID=1087449 RepID=UPI0002895C55|nr:Ig-like domain-containing protein [Aquimarina agarilytica]
MKTKLTLVLSLASLLGGINTVSAQSVPVDINLDIKHSVGGVSDFGRERHITVHANLSEPDWVGEEEKVDYLFNKLDAYLGRDNGRATFLFEDTPVDPRIANYPHIDSMAIKAAFWNGEYEKLEPFRLQYEARSSEMIMGTNPHPTYPTLSWFDNGLTKTDPAWQPKDVTTTADWVVEYLDKYFAKNDTEDGPQLPKYWEVINEPDMLMMTGQFMVTSQEKLWEYHNLVAKGVKERLGSQAPLIGGMTWGQHDFHLPDGLGRFDVGHYDKYLTPEQIPVFFEMSKTDLTATRNNEWYQWDVMWKGFMDTAGENMDFYSVHVYDWPIWNGNAPNIRSGGHTEAMLDMMEWYDVHKFGKRKDVVISEYGAVTNYIDQPGLDPARRDWENLKPFSQMMMQFLERPDYIIKTMPFTPLKAEWGDYRNANGEVTSRYPYTMMDQDANGDWQWSEFIKWYELWSDVKGTRIDTKAGDLDIQVDAYVDGNTAYLILNNLERTDKTLDLNFFGENGNTIDNVTIKHLYLNGNQPTLTDNTVNSAPKSVTLGAEATMILAYNFSSDIAINHTSKEKKYYGESLSGSNGATPHRVKVENGTMTAQVNGVAVPSKGEAMLRLCGAYFWEHVTRQDDRNVISVNGFPLEFNSDWRGEDPQKNVFFGVLEIPIPLEYLKTNNVIKSTLQNSNTYTNVSIQVWDMSKNPGRTDGGDVKDTIDVTGISLTAQNTAVDMGQTVALNATIAPTDATNQLITWSSSEPSIATVNGNGVVSGIAAGKTSITATTADGNFTDTIEITVNPAVVTIVDVTAVNVTTTSNSITVGQTTQVTANVVPANATNKAINWSSNNTSVATVDTNGLVLAVAEGSAIITATTDDGGFSDTTTISVNKPVVIIGDSLLIQAEDFSATGGTFGGFETYTIGNITATNFNQTGDWAEYTVTIADGGTYQVDYLIATPLDNTAIEFILDGNSIMTDNVPNNGDWDSFTSLKGSQNVALTSGAHTIRLLGAGTNGWEWNLNYFQLSKVEEEQEDEDDTIEETTPQELVIEAELFNSTGGTIDDAAFGGSGLGVTASGSNINYVNSGDWAAYEINIPVAGDYAIEYLISTPSDNAQIQLMVDGTLVATDNVPNNGQWDSYEVLNAANSVTLTAGSHTIRVNASGSNIWQWNLDKITLKTGNTTGAKSLENSFAATVVITPNPADQFITINGLNQAANYVVYDFIGAVVLEGTITNGENINVSGIASGMYFIQFSANGRTSNVTKFLKK